MIDTGADPADRAAFIDLFRPLTEPAALARAHAINARMDELADAGPDDPRVPGLAADLLDHIPDEMVSALANSLDTAEAGRWLDTMTWELSGAQAAVFRRLAAMAKERAAERATTEEQEDVEGRAGRAVRNGAGGGTARGAARLRRTAPPAGTRGGRGGRARGAGGDRPRAVGGAAPPRRPAPPPSRTPGGRPRS